MFDLLNYFLTYFVIFVPLIYLFLILYRLRESIFNSKIIILTYTFLVILLLHKVIFFDQTLSAQDFNNIQIPFFESLNKSLKEHSLVPIWDNSFGGGFDVFSNPLAFYFSSFTFIFYFVNDTYLAANFYIASQIILLGIFSFLFLKELGFQKYTSFAGSLLLTFNGFVLMRLSPGVGPEYLFTYKWLPLVLLFSYTFFYKNFKKDFIFLAISLAFLFEGNPNIAIAGLILWLVFIFIFGQFKKIEFYLNILKLGLFSFMIYCVKILPGFLLMISSEGRISEIVGGWRSTRVIVERILSYYLPLKDTYLPGPFTPGLIGFSIFILGVLLVLLLGVKNKSIEKKYIFAFTASVLGLMLTSLNPISEFIFALPFFNRLTINPSFYIFLIIPLGIFASAFWDIILNKFPKKSWVLIFLIFLVSFISFLEVLRGPSTFGKSSYSFNFDKMPVSEIEEYKLYKALKYKADGNFVFIDANKIFNLPNITKIYGLKDINRHSYFYGSAFQNELNESEKIAFYKTHANYLISLKDIDDKDLEIVEKVDMTNYLKDYLNYAVLINKNDFSNLVSINDWDQYLRVYKVQDSVSIKSVSLNSNHPYYYSYLLNEKNIKDGYGITSVSFSNNWVIKNQKGENVKYLEGENGLLVLENVKPYEIIYFTYVNLYIYFGLLISFCTFIIVIKDFYKKEILALKI